MIGGDKHPTVYSVLILLALNYVLPPCSFVKRYTGEIMFQIERRRKANNLMKCMRDITIVSSRSSVIDCISHIACTDGNVKT
jgi:hypothetical protein